MDDFDRLRFEEAAAKGTVVLNVDIDNAIIAIHPLFLIDYIEKLKDCPQGQTLVSFNNGPLKGHLVEIERTGVSLMINLLS